MMDYATMKDLVEKAQILAEKKGKFKGEWKKLVLGLLLKMSEKSLLKYAFVRNSS